MAKRKYISVILPLKLEWEPCYWTMDEGIEVGRRVEVPLGGKDYPGVVSEVGIAPAVTPARIKGISKAETGLADVSAEEIGLWRKIAKYYMCTVGEVYKAAYPAGIVTAERKASAGKEPKKSSGKEPKKSSGKTPAGQDGWSLSSAQEKVKLTEAQTAAEEGILAAFADGKTALLNGVTGSGKTEIYISLALRALAAGRNVLYLVPEIALSRQLEARLRKVFADRLLVSHSGETPARRFAVVESIRTMQGYIALGTRSAVFLPHHDLGLIVVDEEQDASYKQDAPAPRYNARDVALMMASRPDAGEGRDTLPRCDVVLGSATPSLEALYNCRIGKFREICLDQRYFGTDASGIEIIDTSAERKKRGMKGSFSRKLIDRIQNCLDNGEQIMILRTRRGYSPVVQCLDCGYIPRCPHCNVSLTYHKDVGKIRCHHCGYSLTMTDKCSNCGGELTALGAGTQKIEEEATALFPSARIARLDSDVQQSRRAEKDIIKQFSSGAIDILIGTQIVAKGFDFDNLALVAVLQTDALLGLLDFRADEKALQTLAQFRGRSGRRGRPGLLVIQTSRPDHPVYAALREGQGDFRNSHIAGLLQEREEFNYPPFTRIINVSIRHFDEAKADSLAKKLALDLQDFRMDGPFTPSTGKDADQYVRMIRITLDKDRELSRKKDELQRLIDVFTAKEHCQDNIVLDVDPA